MDEQLQALLQQLEGYVPGAADIFSQQLNQNKIGGEGFGRVNPVNAAVGGIDSADEAAGEAGGFLGITGKSAGIGAGVSAISNALVPQPKGRNAKFFNDNRDLEKQLDSELGIQNVRSSITNATSAIPIIGPIAKLADSIGTGVDRATKDEFGIYKSGGAQVLDRILDPVGNITDLFTGGFDQEGRKSKKRTFENRELASKIGQEKQTGNIVRNNLPQYKAPSYGKQGMKFKSKFAS